jgi:hypothetical protein
MKIIEQYQIRFTICCRAKVRDTLKKENIAYISFYDLSEDSFKEIQEGQKLRILNS